MSKFLLNLVLHISKALLNSKIQFLIQKFLFPYFRPGLLPYFFQPSRGPPPPSLSGLVGPSPAPLVRFGRLSISVVACSACLIRLSPPSR
jgi:hypothetical protein